VWLRVDLQVKSLDLRGDSPKTTRTGFVVVFVKPM
jgi:hypothetical protein